MRKSIQNFFVFFLFSVVSGTGLHAQIKPVSGLHENTPNVVALTHARIVIAPGKVIEKGTVVIRGGHIEAVGAAVKIPADAVVRDYSGKTIYPGFIDLYSDYGIQKPKPTGGNQRGRSSGMFSPFGSQAMATDAQQTGTAHWSSAVRAHSRAGELFKPDAKKAASLRKLGFTALVTLPKEGIFRGSGSLVLLGEDQTNKLIVAEDVVQGLSFSRGRGSRGQGTDAYPRSLMGVIALMRQTFLDADWYARAWRAYEAAPAGQEAPIRNIALEALHPFLNGQKPFVIEAGDELAALRAARLAKEFSLDMWVRGSGKEYRRAQALKKSGLKLIIPLNFPKAPDVSTRERELDVTLRDLRHWDMAPENAAMLAQAGMSFALTASGLKKGDNFLKNLRTAVARGLAPEKALAALTQVPANWLGLSRLIGSVEPGKYANLIVTDGDIFKKETTIYDTWVGGRRYEVTAQPEKDLRGVYALTIRTGAQVDTGRVRLTGKAAALKAGVKLGGHKIKAKKVLLEGLRLGIVFPGDSLGRKGLVRMSGLAGESGISGSGTWEDGTEFTWEARFLKAVQEKPGKKDEKKVTRTALKPVFPDGAYGLQSQPEQPEVLIVKNATIWTSGPQGILDNADMIVRRGKIQAVGKNLKTPKNALVIDATGKHLTPGLIDAHAHIALAAINEGSHSVVAEVRTQDVINSDDISIYRQLAGGLTMANLLHGSANPIGGQNSVIKLRWGALPEELLFDGAMPGIKFALGENVKRSRIPGNTRYPNTRMGVEQIFEDHFQAAKDYRTEWENYRKARKKNKNLIPPRRNLRLETLLEILDGKRQIHCHSYRQDEILALIRVADRMGFKVDVFTHILEGYKVAEAMKKHGAMASCFSDWWAYKFEVYDAIPYNGAIMHEQGIVVSYNSDSAELARRMNTEASKAVKYGGVPPEEAFKFVTLNPAKQLRIEHRVGSLEKGKDADFVIWNGSPLSSLSRAEQTWIDGRKYFDIELDREMQKANARERAELVQKILSSGAPGGKGPGAGGMRRRGAEAEAVIRHHDFDRSKVGHGSMCEVEGDLETR